MLETLICSHASGFLTQVFTIYQVNEHLTLNQLLSKQLEKCIRWLVFAHYLNHYENKKRIVANKKNLVKFYEENHALIENVFFHLINNLYHWMLTNED